MEQDDSKSNSVSDEGENHAQKPNAKKIGEEGKKSPETKKTDSNSLKPKEKGDNKANAKTSAHKDLDDEEENDHVADLNMSTMSMNHPKLEVGFTCKHGWYEIRPHGKLPEKRSHHSSVVYNGHLYIFGGEDNKEGKYDTLWRLNLDAFIEIGDKIMQHNEDDEEMKQSSFHTEDANEDVRLQWELVQTSGTKPGPLSYHKAAIKDDLMYVFGGMDANGDCNGNLYILNLSTFEWSVDLTHEGRPEARDDISMVATNTALYVFGGFVRGKRMNDLHMYTFETKKWECLFDFYDVNEFSSPEEQLKCPCLRSGEDIAIYNNKIYVFGGRNDFNDKLNDTWEFDIASKSWTKISVDEQPIGRSHHTLVTHSNRMILFGGIVEITKEINEIHQYDFTGKKWT